LAGGMNLLLAFLLELRSSRPRKLTFAIQAALLCALAGVAASSVFYSKAFASFSAVLYRNSHQTTLTPSELANLEDVIYFEDGINATISVTRSDDYVSIKTNGKVDASNLDQSTQLLLGDLGAVFHPHPRNVLIIGLGAGMTASAVSRFPDVERIDCIEIEPAVLHAQTYLTRLNRGVLKDPRVHMILDDARNVIQTQHRLYDLIISEPSNPWVAGVATLYTDEFYAALRERLAPGGMFVQWVQAYSLELDDFRMILASLAPHFADVSLWHSANRDFLVLARTDASSLSFTRARSLWTNSQLHDDFRDLHLTSPESWPVYFRLNDQQVRSLAEGAPNNSDDRTALEYRAPRALLNQSSGDPLDVAIVNRYWPVSLTELAPAEVSPALSAMAESAVELNSPLAGYYLRALPASLPSAKLEFLRGRVALLEGRPAEAKAHFEVAGKGEPNSLVDQYWLAIAQHASGETALGDALLDEVLKHHPGDRDAMRQAVAFASDERNWQSAIAAQQRLLAAMPTAPALEYCRLGDFYLRAGDAKNAVKPFQDGLQRDSYSFLCRREFGELLRATGRVADGVKELEFVVEHFPQADAKTYISLALAYQSERREQDAQKILEKGRRVFPGDTNLQQFQLRH